MPAGSGVTLDTQIVKKEQVLNLIKLLDMKKTPFLNRVEKGPQPWNPINSWTVDNYAAPSTAGVPDGQDVDSFDDTAINRAELEVYIQQWRRPWKVSQFAQRMSVYGLAQGESAEAVRKSMVHIMRDIECTFLSDNPTTKTGGVKKNELRTRGLGDWIKTTAQSTFPVPKEYRPSAAQIISGAITSNVTEANLKKMMAAIFDSTGYSASTLVLMCGSALRQRVTAMTLHGGDDSPAANRRIQADSKSVVDTVDTYEGDFNRVSIVPNNFIGWSDEDKKPDIYRGYALDMENIEVGFLDYKISKELENRGGGRRGFVDSFGVLRVLTPTPHGKFAAVAD